MAIFNSLVSLTLTIQWMYMNLLFLSFYVEHEMGFVLNIFYHCLLGGF